MANNYVEFCSSARRKLTKCLYDDLLKALTYDSEMFCFLLPSVFGEIAATGSFPVTGNIDLIRLVASAIDPVHLQELICLCLTGTTKVINKEDVMPLVGKLHSKRFIPDCSNHVCMKINLIDNLLTKHN